MYEKESNTAPLYMPNKGWSELVANFFFTFLPCLFFQCIDINFPCQLISHSTITTVSVLIFSNTRAGQVICINLKARAQLAAYSDPLGESREEQDLLEIHDLKLFGVKTLVSILIEPSLETVFLLESCLV